jgi:hypothetical protein
VAVTAALIAQLRRMVAEPTVATYSDAVLTEYIERAPLIDSLGRDPYVVSTTTPPVMIANPDWAGSPYDLNRVASEIWEEKAGALAAQFDFSEDGQSFSRRQKYENAEKQARIYRAKRSAQAIKLYPYPLANPTAYTVANGPDCLC